MSSLILGTNERAPSKLLGAYLNHLLVLVNKRVFSRAGFTSVLYKKRF